MEDAMEDIKTLDHLSILLQYLSSCTTWQFLGGGVLKCLSLVYLRITMFYKIRFFVLGKGKVLV